MSATYEDASAYLKEAWKLSVQHMKEKVGEGDIDVRINPAVFSEIKNAFLTVLTQNVEKQSPLENPLQQPS